MDLGTRYLGLLYFEIRFRFFLPGWFRFIEFQIRFFLMGLGLLYLQIRFFLLGCPYGYAVYCFPF